MSIVALPSRAAAEALLTDPLVESVVENGLNRPELVQSLPLIGQPAAAAQGYNGSGCVVALLDTGADYTHPDLGVCPYPGAPEPCRVAFARDFTPADDGLTDSSGHGTNVASIIAKVAPGVKILVLDVFKQSTTGDSLAWDADILAAIDWVLKAKADGSYNVCAINLSLGSTSKWFSEICNDSPYTVAFAAARAAGIVPAAAAGNAALKGRLPTPACTPGAVSVGATYDQDLRARDWRVCGDEIPVENHVTCFSNSAPFLTILAPGAIINAGGWSMAGTSQAVPHVTGSIAVLKSLAPSATSDQVVAALLQGGIPTLDPSAGVTTPRINLWNSIEALRGILSKQPPESQLDTAAPTCSVQIVSADGPALTYSINVTLAIVGSDPSGIDAMCITNAGAKAASAGCTAWEPFAEVKQWRLEEGPFGSRAVGVFLRDTLGNAMLKPALAETELVPVTTVAVSGGAAFTASRAINLSISALGADPATTKMCASLTARTLRACSTWVPFSRTRKFTLGTAQRKQTVRVFFKHPKLDLPPASVDVTYDAQAPKMTSADMRLNATAAGPDSLIIQYVQAAKDAVSGVASYLIVGQEGPAPPAARCSSSPLRKRVMRGAFAQETGAAGLLTDAVTFVGLKGQSTYSIRVCAVDAANNTALGVVLVAKTD